MIEQPLWQAFINDEKTRHHLQALAEQFSPKPVIIEKGDISTAPSYLDSHLPSRLLIVELTQPEEVFQAIQALDDKCFVNTRIIALTHGINEAYAKQLSAAGIDSCLQLPIDPTHLTQLLTSSIIAIRQQGLQQTIMVTGCRGGLGTSSLAQNIAYLTAKKISTPVVLVDYDFYFGTVTMDLDQSPNHGLATALEQHLTITLDELLNLTQTHSEWLHTLTSDLPLNYQLNTTHLPTRIQKIFDLLHQHFRATVVDLGRTLHASPHAADSSALLQQATQYVIATPQTLVGLRDCERLVNYYREINPEAGITVFSCPWHPVYKREFTRNEFSAKLCHPVIELPYSARLAKGSNMKRTQGRKYTKALERFIDSLTIEVNATKSISLWRKLWGI